MYDTITACELGYSIKYVLVKGIAQFILFFCSYFLFPLSTEKKTLLSTKYKLDMNQLRNVFFWIHRESFNNIMREQRLGSVPRSDEHFLGVCKVTFIF